MSESYKKGSENMSSPLKNAAKFDPNSAIQDAQARIDAEDTSVKWFTRPIVLTAVIAIVAVLCVVGYYFIDHNNTKQSIENCLFHLQKLDTSDQTIESCTLAAKEGEKKAIIGLAGIYVAKDRKDLAYPYLKECAEESNAMCEYFLSSIYRDGVSSIIQPDLAKYMLWINRAAEHGSVQANYTLYQIYLNGDDSLSVPKSYKTANQFLRKAAELGHAASLYQMSENYQTGAKEYQADYAKSIDYLKLAADHQHPIALGKYGLYLLEREETEEALSYLQKGANAGDPLSCTLLADLYRNGVVKQEDNNPIQNQRIIDLYLVGAEAGNEDAISNLIDMYHDEEDSLSYTKWLRIALDHNVSDAYGKMGQAIEEEFVIEKPEMPSDNDGLIIHEVLKEKPNLEAAVQFYRKGVARHDNFAYRKLLEIYSLPEFKGRLNASLFALAKDYASVEPEYGLEYLAYCYANGLGTSQNEEKARELLAQRISNYDDIPLALIITKQYLSGTGSRYSFKKDIKQAVKFAELMINTDNVKGIEAYLSLINDILNGKIADKQLVIPMLENLSKETKELFNDNLEYQSALFFSNVNLKRNNATDISKLTEVAESLVSKESQPAIYLYANLSREGKILFKSPNYQKAIELYEKLAKEEGGYKAGESAYNLADIYANKLDKNHKDFKKALDYAKLSAKLRYDPSIKFIITNFISDIKNKEKNSLLHITEKYYYLKLAEMLKMLDRNAQFHLEKIVKEMNEAQISQGDQKVYEEMAARKAAEVNK